MEISGCVLKL